MPNIYYSKEEKQYIIKLRKNKVPVADISVAVNNKFWKGEPIRTFGAIDRFLYRNNIVLTPHGIPSKNILTDSFTRIIELYEDGVSYENMSKMLRIPLGTVKSRVSMYLNNIKYRRTIVKTEKDNINKVLVEKVKILSKELLLVKKQLSQEKALKEIVVDTISDVIKEITPIKVATLNIKYKKQTRKPEIAMIDLSDWHFGAKEEPIDIMNMGHYNWNEAMRRLGMMATGTMECLDIILRSIPLEKIYINLLGDMCDGEAIFRGHGRSIDKATAQQAFGAAEAMIEKFIVPIYRYFSLPMGFYCVNGNHGRAAGKNGEVHRLTNWDYVMYQHMAARLAPINKIDFNISDSTVLLYDIKETPKWRHMILHGSGIRSWSGTPYYGIDRACMRLQNLFGMPIHYVHIGHFHQSANIDMPRGEKLISGSAIGATEFSVDALQTGSEAKQSIYGFNDRYGKTWEWQIRLAPLKNLTADPKGIYTPVSKIPRPLSITTS